MFWKKKKEEKMLGKFVKYSKSTAKVNPNMIIAEYDRLIKKEKSELPLLNDKKYWITVLGERGYDGIHHGDRFKINFGVKKTEISLRVDKLVELAEEIKKQKNKYMELTRKIRGLENEKALFIKCYVELF